MTRVVWTLPHKSQEFIDGPAIQFKNDRLILAYDYETEHGAYAWSELTFLNTIAYCFTASRHCRVDQIQAFDEVQEVGESSWSENLTHIDTKVSHFRIYFDEIGCYEILASQFVPPASEI